MSCFRDIIINQFRPRENKMIIPYYLQIINFFAPLALEGFELHFLIENSITRIVHNFYTIILLYIVKLIHYHLEPSSFCDSAEFAIVQNYHAEAANSISKKLFDAHHCLRL
jgi:hypothetical protein